MFLLRHGQSYFNLHFSRTRVDPGIEDPELTPLGREQAAAAAEKLADRLAGRLAGKLAGRPAGGLSRALLTRIIVSPYTRALQTAQPFLARHDAPVEIMHEVRERAAFACDVGSTPDVLAARFPHHDFAHLPKQWWHPGVEPAGETIARANAFRALVAARGDSATTLLISHWAFILALSGKSAENGEILEYDPAQPPPAGIELQ